MAVTLIGNELLYVNGLTPNGQLAATLEPTTTGAIAALAATSVNQVTNTAVTTTGATGTFSAAALTGGLITRSGPTGAFTDTFASAGQTVTALGGFTLGEQFYVTIKNTTTFTETLASPAPSFVILPTTVIIGALQEATYVGTVGGTSGAPSITYIHINTVPIAESQSVNTPQAVALTTVGAGTITAAGMVAGVTARSGTQVAAFTDTTDIATSIVAASVGLIGKVGASFLYTYNNNTTGAGGYPATIQGGTGVTVSGITVVPANGWATYLITQTSANILTMVGIAQGHFAHSGTFVANETTGVVVANTAVTANSTVTFGMNTPSGTVAGAPYVYTLTAGTSFSIKAGAADLSTYNYTIWG